MSQSITWNDSVKIIISDVDETIAGVYIYAEPEMITQLAKVLERVKMLVLISGHGLHGLMHRVTDSLPSKVRKKILIAHCSATEVWGFNEDGSLQSKPFYSLYESSLSAAQKDQWRVITNQLVTEFKLKVFPTMPKPVFVVQSGADPLSIMLDDRGPQITFEVVNGIDLSSEQVESFEYNVPETHGRYDLRIPILERAEQLFAEAKLPLSPRLAGTFAIDFAVKGVSKTTAIHYILQNKEILSSLGVTEVDIADPASFEIWGDKFSALHGGTDRHMSEALPKEVRSIDFREEDPAEFLPGYNTVVWQGEKHLQDGLLEYLLKK